MLYKVVLTVESADEILKCDHSNESYWAVLSCGTVYYAVQGGSNCWVCEWNPKVWPFKWKLTHISPHTSVLNWQIANNLRSWPQLGKVQHVTWLCGFRGSCCWATRANRVLDSGTDTFSFLLFYISQDSKEDYHKKFSVFSLRIFLTDQWQILLHIGNELKYNL